MSAPGARGADGSTGAGGPMSGSAWRDLLAPTCPTETVADLARRIGPACVDVVDVDELVAAIEAAGVNDRTAQQRYGTPTVFALAEAVLAHLRTDVAHRLARLAAADRPPARPPRHVRQALLRSALYVTPVPLAIAAADPLGQVPWPVPAGALVLGWSAGQGLAYLGHLVGAQRGPGSATRLLAGGFAVLAGAWSVLLALLPAWLVDGRRPMAYAITLIELAFFAAVGTALVTRRERDLLRWTLPSWVVAGVAIGGAWPAHWPVRVEWALLGSIVLIVGRALRQLGAPATGSGLRIGAGDLVRAGGYLLIGLGQSTAFVLVWRAAPGGSSAPPAVLPLLAAIPLVEIFVGWHLSRVALGLDTYDDHRAYRRHLRRVAGLSIVLLLPPLLSGVVLATAADHLPMRLSDHADVRTVLLALASGVLLAGVFAMVLLLSTRRWLATAALLATAPAGLAVGLTFYGTPAALAGVPRPLAAPTDGAPLFDCVLTCTASESLLPNAVLSLTVVFVLGLSVSAYALFDPRSYR